MPKYNEGSPVTEVHKTSKNSKTLKGAVLAVLILAYQWVGPEFGLTPLPDDLLEVVLTGLVGGAAYARLRGKPAVGQVKNHPEETKKITETEELK